MKTTEVKHSNTVTFKTAARKVDASKAFAWWTAKSKREVCDQLLSTAAFLKTNQEHRFRSAAIYARLYGNQSLFNFAGSSLGRAAGGQALPVDRPTFNLVQATVDTLLSKITQQRPSPVFLTDNGDYKQRTLAKKLNNFVGGEFYRTKAYDKAALIFRDALVEGTGCLKIYKGADGKVALDRVLLTELLTDPNESIYGEPRQLYQLKLIDRSVLIDQCPGMARTINEADRATVDNSVDSSKSVSDLVMVVEGWRLPSGPGAKDGRHTLACTSGIIFDETYEKPVFPFVFLHYSPRLLGFWAQGLAEQLMGTQLEINSLLYTISKAIKLVGVPRVMYEHGSKIVKAHFNNDIGTMIGYTGTKPSYEVAPCVPEELYAQLQRLIDYGFQQAGVSMLQASSQKPAGLNSGAAIRSYDDISTDRFATISRRYDTLFVDLAYAVVDCASDIAEEEGKYSTVYPNKDGTKEIDLPKAAMAGDPFVIQVFNQSALPKDPAGRRQEVAEMITSGMITLREGRRLLNFPDLEQMDKLANAAEERMFQILDAIVEEGEYTPPDPFLDLELCKETVVQYYNLYSQAKLEEDRCQMLRDWYTQVLAFSQTAAATPGASAGPTAPPVAGAVPAPTVTAPPAMNAVTSQAA